MKKLLIALLIGTMMSIFSGCSNNIGAAPKAPNKEGVQPYALSESNKKLLQSLGLENKVNIVSFKAPKSVRSLEINTYILGKDKIWKKNDGGKISLGKDSNPDDILEGNVAMLLKENYKVEIHVSTSDRASYQIGGIVNEGPPTNDSSTRMSSRSFLMEFKKIELNKEIPVAIMVYYSGTSMRSYSVENFFSPTDFAEMDLVQAVTLTFTDKAD